MSQAVIDELITVLEVCDAIGTLRIASMLAKRDSQKRDSTHMIKADGAAYEEIGRSYRKSINPDTYWEALKHRQYDTPALGRDCRYALNEGNEQTSRCLNWIQGTIPLPLERIIPNAISDTLTVADIVYGHFVDAMEKGLELLLRLDGVIGAIFALVPLVLAFAPGLLAACERTTAMFPENAITTFIPAGLTVANLVLMSLLLVMVSQAAQSILIWAAVIMYACVQLCKPFIFLEVAGPHTNAAAYKEDKKRAKCCGYIPVKFLPIFETLIPLVLVSAAIGEIDLGLESESMPYTLTFQIITTILNFFKAKTLTVVAGADLFVALLAGVAGYEVVRPHETKEFRGQIKYSTFLEGNAEEVAKTREEAERNRPGDEEAAVMEVAAKKKTKYLAKVKSINEKVGAVVPEDGQGSAAQGVKGKDVEGTGTPQLVAQGVATGLPTVLSTEEDGKNKPAEAAEAVETEKPETQKEEESMMV